MEKPAPEQKPKSEKKDKEHYEDNTENISKISLWLDRYGDIFSDFDPRPYSQRELSDDFLYEAKKMARERAKGAVELNLLVPAFKRKYSKESIIKKRLRQHFKYHFELLSGESKKMRRQGILFTFFGVVLMIIASFILFEYPKGIFVSFLITLFEPASWFLFWEGMHIMIFSVKSKKPDIDFYNKMSKCRINFRSY